MGRSAKKGANTHNSKHENGVVAPGKRVAKQKSNGHINGSADERVKEIAPSVPAIPSQSLAVPNEPVGIGNASAPKSRSLSGSRQALNKSSATTVSDEAKDLELGEGPNMAEHQYRKIDVNSVKQAAAPEGGPFHLALTVLRSCPISDTIAILMFLLSLPPTFLNLTNAMFALLTFVPPSGSFTTLPSLTDITSSFSPATPSFIVLILIDFLAISLWYLIPFPLCQGILLDCAQATVATTLGGGYTYRPGTSDNLLMMLLAVGLTHLGRYRKTTLRLLHKTPLAKWLPMVDSFEDIPPRPSYALGPNRTWLDTIKIWVAIHILFQGLTRMVRRSLHSSRSTSIFSSHSRSIDPEAVTTFQTGEGSEALHNPPSSPSILKSKSSLQHLRDVGNKISSGKRRKKQANYVRSQQPLWAAFAATKATIIREYEQSQATRDARGSNAEGVENLGNAPFAKEENGIWVTAICQDRFYFETGPFPQHKHNNHYKKNCAKLEGEAGIDPTKPFYVRINGANWASVKIEEIAHSADTLSRTYWVGEVYGLSPASTYRVSFARCGDGVELHPEVIVTSSPPIAEQASSPANPAPAPNMRPSSPASPVATLKTSIAAFESSINDTVSEQKRIRKDSKATVAALRKELDGLADRLAKLAHNDKTSGSRQLQLSQNIRQAEDAVSTLSEDIEAFAEVPKEILAEWQDHKAGWEQMRNEHSRVQEDLSRTKEDNRRGITAIQQEQMNLGQKKDRLQIRINKLSDQHKRLTSTATAPENRRTQSDQSTRSVERDRTESKLQGRINNLQQKYQDVTLRYQAVYHQIYALEQAAEIAARQQQAQQARLQYDSRPITPEGDLPGTNPNISNSSTLAQGRYGAFGTPELQTTVPASGFGSAGTNELERDNSHRRRSHSALSGGGLGFVGDEEDDEGPIPPEHKRKSGIGSVLEGSDGRSSGSGSPHVPYVPYIGQRNKNGPAVGLPT